MKLAKVFGDDYYSNDPQKILEELFSSVRSENLNIQVIKQLFLKPYLPAVEICKESGVSKSELKKINNFIRSSQNSKELFAYSPYPYLVNTLERLSKDDERVLRILRGEKPFPLSESLELFISESCNARCKFCYRNGNSYHHRAKVLSTAQYAELINEFADLNGQNIDVTGGLEPLLSHSLLGILKTGIERKLNVRLYTNGIALGDNHDITEQILKIQRVRVSLNACSSKSYKEIMGVDKFERVIENLRRLVEAKRKSKSNVKVGAGFAIFKQNYTSIPEALELAQKLELDFLDLRAVEVTSVERFDQQQRTELKSILTEVKQKKMRNEYGSLSVSVADTFNAVIDPETDCMKYVKKDLVKELLHFRVTVTPYGRVYALNLIGQPSREDDRFLLGKIRQNSARALSRILSNGKNIPYDENSLLAHDMTLMMALSKLDSDLEFGINIEENPFNWINPS
jgi:TDP-4-amino-4,6-dideoxy-D-glucose deaminase